MKKKEGCTLLLSGSMTERADNRNEDAKAGKNLCK